jgi:hypothetical protein
MLLVVPAAARVSTTSEPTSVSSQALDLGAQMVQAPKPVKQMKLHTWSFVLYSHDMGC